MGQFNISWFFRGFLEDAIYHSAIFFETYSDYLKYVLQFRKTFYGP